MFAVIRSGGKQYKVAKDDLLTIERIEGDEGAAVTLGEVLMLGGDSPKIGAPLVKGASVQCEIVEHGQGEKVIAFKKKRRKNTHRKRGHRQHFTTVKVLSITAGKEEVMAHKKAGGSSRNGRDSNPKMLGVKLFGGESVSGGNVIVRQRGTKFYAGEGVGMGKDHTLFAKVGGKVAFKKGIKQRTFVSIVATGSPRIANTLGKRSRCAFAKTAIARASFVPK